VKSLYFDNAATSWPKPKSVMRAMGDFFLKGGGNPGRSGHGRSIDAGRVVLKTREQLAEFFNIRDSSRIVFTKNATEALNTAINGLAGGGDHVVTTSMEHNSVMRPLSHLRDKGCSVSVVSADKVGLVSPESILKAVTANTKLVIVTHASNVTGTVNDIGRIGQICREKNILYLVDAAQTVGGIPIDVEKCIRPRGAAGFPSGSFRERYPERCRYCRSWCSS
jgi:selenocysteine lyase/cysteine desulfurase